MVANAHGVAQKIELPNVKLEGTTDYDFMFPELLGNPDNFLPNDPKTIERLDKLGRSMTSTASNDESTIPAVFTYFGQFIDHDITKTVELGALPSIEDPNFKPFTQEHIKAHVKNARTLRLDLDSVYGASSVKDDDGRMIVGAVSCAPFGRIPITDKHHDLPRKKKLQDPQSERGQKRDREARIGDSRNDENLIIAQLHVAFLRAHNALMDRGLNAKEAKKALRQRYQLAVLHDFLGHICDKDVFDKIIKTGPDENRKIAKSSGLFMPVEFAQAAYRFGHSLVRQDYDYNRTFPSATFNLLFTFTALSGDFSPRDGHSTQSDSLPDNWVIEWDRFLGATNNNLARKIDTNLAPELASLRNFQGVPFDNLMAKLAVRNLLRGYLFHLPTGQAVATHLGVKVLTPDNIKNSVPEAVVEALVEGAFLDRTPLWLYVLAEANFQNQGNRLGKVGSTIVAETLWNLIKHSKNSVLHDDFDINTIPANERTLEGIIKIGIPDGVILPLGTPAPLVCQAVGTMLS